MGSARQSQIADRIRQLEGWQEGSGGPVFVPRTVLARDMGLVRLKTLSRFWGRAATGPSELVHWQERLLAGLCGNAIPWVYLVMGEANGLAIYFGLPGGSGVLQTWETHLSAALPGCEFCEGPKTVPIVDKLIRLPWAVTMTGNPSLPAVHQEAVNVATIARPGIESVFRTMQGTEWAYAVFGRPVSQREVQETLSLAMQEERELVSTYLRRGTAEEANNPQAQHYLDLLRATRNHHELATRQGMWDIYVLLLARVPDRLALGTQALLAAFAGPESRPQPIRVRACVLNRGDSHSTPLCTRLTSREAAYLARPPVEEFPGVPMRELVDFAVSVPAAEASERVALGIVLDRGHRTANWFELEREQLCKHALIAGVTGSGKTQTCQYLLRQLWEEHQIPWLVMEPAMKSEYRCLLATPAGRDLRVFTLGDETCVPLRFNPLEVQPGVPVQSHIDGLIALFNAAFALVTPMPYVLALALHRVYSERGWDLTTGEHPLGYGPQAQPTLSDLMVTVGRLVRELGYDKEITGNIRAGLQTRLTSLTTGAKGRMLDGLSSLPMEYLLSRPTVLEFAAMGNDEDKAFVLGAMLLHLAEHRRVGGLAGNRLRHVTVVEEAHRLLAAMPQNLAQEEANSRGKAVESFCNMLAEVRAYGEGILIVDQVPTKLAPEILKNTNLKVIHRLVAEEERQRVGGCMNMSEEHVRYLSTLRCGHAAVYAEGCERAYLVQIPNHFCQFAGQPTYPDKETLMQHMHDRLPVRSDSDPIRQRGSLPGGRDWAMPVCRGCDQGSCAMQESIVEHLLSADHADEFAHAVAGGWGALWVFGEKCAQQIWPIGDTPADAPYCVLMTIVALAGYDESLSRKFRRNLTLLRERERGRRE